MKLVGMKSAAAWVVAAVALSLATVYILEAREGGGEENRRTHFGDPSRYLPGTERPELVDEVTAFDRYPVLWLGPSFEGLNLVAVQGVDVTDPDHPGFGGSYRDQRLMLIYGDCVADTSGETPSCAPPLAVQVYAGNLVPPIEQVKAPGSSNIYEIRGVSARDVDISTYLWFDNGLRVSVGGDPQLRERALQALVLANAKAIGVPDIAAGKAPGDDLSAIGEIPVPQE